MHDLIVEELPGSSTKDLARHLYTRMWSGTAVVIAEKPVVTLSSLHKQWLKLTRKVQEQRVKTEDPAYIHELTKVVTRMQSLVFTDEWPQDDHPAQIYVATIEQLLRWPPECRTMYITCDIEREKLHMLTSWMPKNGLVVIDKPLYKRGTGGRHMLI